MPYGHDLERRAAFADGLPQWRDLVGAPRPLHLVPSPACADCDDALDKALRILRPAMRARDAVVSSPPLPVVVGRPDELVELFRRIVADALDTPSGRRPHVEVDTEMSGAYWTISFCGGVRPSTLAGTRELASRLGGEAWIEAPRGWEPVLKVMLPAAEVSGREG